MSWYSRGSGVQGGFDAMNVDDDERRRRLHRNAGSALVPSDSGQVLNIPPVQAQYVQPQHPAQAAIQQPQGGAPRMSAAVDMGQGAVQQPLNIPPVQAVPVGQQRIEHQYDERPEEKQHEVDFKEPEPFPAPAMPHLEAESRYAGIPQEPVQRRLDMYGPVGGRGRGGRRKRDRGAPYEIPTGRRITGSEYPDWGAQSQRAVVPAGAVQVPQRGPVLIGDRSQLPRVGRRPSQKSNPFS